MNSSLARSKSGVSVFELPAIVSSGSDKTPNDSRSCRSEEEDSCQCSQKSSLNLLNESELVKQKQLLEKLKAGQEPVHDHVVASALLEGENEEPKEEKEKDEKREDDADDADEGNPSGCPDLNADRPVVREIVGMCTVMAAAVLSVCLVILLLIPHVHHTKACEEIYLGDLTYRRYYDTLGIPETASYKDMSNAFRNLAMKHHPDRNPASDLRRWRNILMSWKVLKCSSIPDRIAVDDEWRSIAERRELMKQMAWIIPTLSVPQLVHLHASLGRSPPPTTSSFSQRDEIPKIPARVRNYAPSSPPTRRRTRTARPGPPAPPPPPHRGYLSRTGSAVQRFASNVVNIVSNAVIHVILTFLELFRWIGIYV